jgi:rhodanese-related sulfurtransferase
VAGGWAAGLAVVAGSTPAQAIPSPELVIGSISSLAQLGTLAAALFGGGAVAIGARAGLRRGTGNSRRLVRVALVLFGIAAVLGGLNIYQFMEHRAQVAARLQATLVRPSRLPGEKVLDPTLRQISFSEQLSHPLGISSDEAAGLLSRGDTVFLDVRERGENEMGTLPGAVHVRFPDLHSSGIDLTGKKVVLLCHNGNRSFETCERLAAMGIDCSFIRGGIEKWIVEGRPFTDPKVGTLSNLRSLPAFPNSATLLDTGQARQLIEDDKATVIDVRYPGAFEMAHLPGAINIPIRATASDELARRIAELPKDRPVVAACYDRRSCFSSQVLGLEMARAGFDFRGRYTLPWEYFKAKPAKPHIAAWLAEQRRGPWQRGIDIVAGWLKSLDHQIGLVLAILLAAIASRLLVLPISLKAERDQIVMRAQADAFAELKSSLKHDPKRMARAIKGFYAEHDLTPMRNLLALAFLPLMAVTLSAVEKAAGTSNASFAWLSTLSERDSTLLVPLAFGLLAGAYLDLVLAKTARHRLAVWLLARRHWRVSARCCRRPAGSIWW